jgi:RNA polymerase sigma-70 factor, ECF subfamily
MGSPRLLNSEFTELSDGQVIDRVLEGDSALYELLVRRYNQRVYRAVRAVLRDDSEAEDVMQEAYVRAFQHLRQFERRASFLTWITRIAIHEALARLERSKRFSPDEFDETDELFLLKGPSPMTPEDSAATSQTRALLEESILALPFAYRTIIMLRDVEEMSTAESAEALEISEDAVKVRLHRARALLKKELFTRAGVTSTSAFQFHAVRCDRVTSAVMQRICS